MKSSVHRYIDIGDRLLGNLTDVFFFFNFVTERTGLPLKILKEYNIKINWKITHVTG